MFRPDFITLRIFLAVYNLGNISKAAARENIASSAISKRLNALEAELGAPLFYRHSRGVEATPAGEALARHALALFGQINKMTSEMSTFASGVAGQVRIHAHTSAIVQYMPSQIASFTKAYPSVKIILVEDSSLGVLQATVEGLTDIGILAGNMDFPDMLDVFEYRHDKLVVLVPADHPLSTSTGVNFAETLEFDHVGLAVTSSLGTLLAGRAGSKSRLSNRRSAWWKQGSASPSVPMACWRAVRRAKRFASFPCSTTGRHEPTSSASRTAVN